MPKTPFERGMFSSSELNMQNETDSEILPPLYRSPQEKYVPGTRAFCARPLKIRPQPVLATEATVLRTSREEPAQGRKTKNVPPSEKARRLKPSRSSLDISQQECDAIIGVRRTALTPKRFTTHQQKTGKNHRKTHGHPTLSSCRQLKKLPVSLRYHKNKNKSGDRRGPGAYRLRALDPRPQFNKM